MVGTGVLVRRRSRAGL